MAQISLTSYECSFLRQVLLASIREINHSIDLDKSLLSSAPADMIETYNKLLEFDTSERSQAEALYNKLLDIL